LRAANRLARASSSNKINLADQHRPGGARRGWKPETPQRLAGQGLGRVGNLDRWRHLQLLDRSNAQLSEVTYRCRSRYRADPDTNALRLA
jgi:hypothetical protein